MSEKVEKELRDRRREALEKADGIITAAEAEGRGTSAEEDATTKALLADAERLKGELEGLTRARAARQLIDEAKRNDVPEVMRQATTPPPAREDETGRIEVRENPHQAYQKGDAFATIVTARIKFAGYEQQKAVRWAEQQFGTGSHQVRALQQSSFTAGGALIPENFVGGEFIELLRAQAAVRRAGARQVTLTNGTFTTPKLTAGVSGAWIGVEGDNITTSEPTFGQLQLVEKKYAVIVPFSNDLRRNASVDAMRVVRDDLVTATANDEDTAFLNGDGISGKPKGIYYWVGAAGRTNSAGTTLANARTDIRVARNRLDNNNVPNIRRAWFMHSRSMNYMGWDLVDGNGNFAFPSLQNSAGASLGGDPVYRDNNISITLSTNQSQIFYVEMSECFIGDNMAMEIEVFDNAVYNQGSSLRSGISRDESVIRLIRKTDFGMRHTEAAHVLEAVTYGA